MNNKTISEFLSVFLAFFLCIGAVAVIAQLRDKPLEKRKTFSVTYNGEDIFTKDGKIYFTYGEEYLFNVAYTYEFSTDNENTDYSVKIVPNVDEDTDFTFTVDGEEMQYSNVGDLTSGFTLDKQAEYFTLAIPESASLASILQAVYGEAVEAPSAEDCPSPYLYTLVVSSYDESATYYLDFALGASVNVEKIELNPSEIIF